MAFASNNSAFDGFINASIHYERIDPKWAPPLAASRLRKMWRDLTSHYMAAVARK